MDSIIGRIGGKRLLRKHIVPLIPNDIKGYIEPFGGSAWILLAKDRWANLEVYNDLDGELVNLFRIIKYHIEAFAQEMGFLISSREIFNQLKQNRGLTDIQRAARFLYLNKRSFAGLGRNYGCSAKSGGRGSRAIRIYYFLVKNSMRD